MVQIDFFKVKVGAVEQTFGSIPKTLDFVRTLLGKKVEVVFPCPVTGRLKSEFYKVNNKGYILRLNDEAIKFGSTEKNQIDLLN